MAVGGKDLSGKTLFACIRLDEGFFTTEDACGRMALGWHDQNGFRSPDVYGDYEKLCMGDKGKWLMVSLPVAAPPLELPDSTYWYPPDPSNVTSVRVVISTACPNPSSLWGNTCDQSSPSYSNMAAPATFHIDSIGYR